jgi:hypothetical protein
MQEPAAAAAQPTSNGQSPWDAQTSVESADQRPEVLVGAAFLGGLVLAQVLKRLGGDDD